MMHRRGSARASCAAMIRPLDCVVLWMLTTYGVLAAFDQTQQEIKKAVQRDFSKLYGQQYICARDNIRAPTPLTLRTALCFCDSQCSRYGDCCVDVDIRDKIEEREGYHCSQLGLRFFYTKMGCGEDDGDDPTFAKYRCEENPERMENVSHLIDQPQFHLKSRTLYKNIYCVLCNMPFSNVKEARGDIYHWKQRYMWFSEEMTPDTWSVVRLTNKWRYDPKVRQYIVSANGSDYKFTVDAEEYDWANFSAHFNTRPCPEVPVIEDCPLRDENVEVDADVEEWEKYCPLYTAYVHSDTLDAYQNVHCALCRGVPLNRLHPGLPSLPEERGTPVGKKGDMFNSYRHKLICKPGEVAVLNSFCSPVLCQPGWIWNGAHCVSQEGEVGCFYLTLEAEWVKFMMNGSVMLVDSKQIFNQYSNITSKSGVPTHVRVCLKTAITVSLEPAQELVAEVCLMSSSVCLLLQLVVYLILPPLRVTRPGKIIMSLSLTILLGHVMFLIKDDVQPGTYLCLSIGLMAHYFYLASFFWMLVMAIDSCRCLALHVFNSKGGPYLMIKYSIVGIFGPALIVCVSVIYDGFSPYSRYAPRYGREVCWIGSRYGLMAFFVVPIVTILLFNFTLFVYTAHTVRQVQTRSEKFRANPSGFQNEMIRLKLYVRLVVVLGFTWFFGVLSALTDISWLWYPFFVLGAAQGVFIFVAFTCKRKVWHELKLLFSGDSQRRRQNTMTLQKQRSSVDATTVSGNSYYRGSSVRRVSHADAPPYYGGGMSPGASGGPGGPVSGGSEHDRRRRSSSLLQNTTTSTPNSINATSKANAATIITNNSNNNNNNNNNSNNDNNKSQAIKQSNTDKNDCHSNSNNVNIKPGDNKNHNDSSSSTNKRGNYSSGGNDNNNTNKKQNNNNNIDNNDNSRNTSNINSNSINVS